MASGLTTRAFTFDPETIPTVSHSLPESFVRVLTRAHESGTKAYELHLTAFVDIRGSCIVNFYINSITMAAEKSVADSFHVSSRFKAPFEVAAARENCGLADMLEALLLEYSGQLTLQAQMSSAAKATEAKK